MKESRKGGRPPRRFRQQREEHSAEDAVLGQVQEDTVVQRWIIGLWGSFELSHKLRQAY